MRCENHDGPRSGPGDSWRWSRRGRTPEQNIATRRDASALARAMLPGAVGDQTIASAPRELRAASM